MVFKRQNLEITIKTIHIIGRIENYNMCLKITSEKKFKSVSSLKLSFLYPFTMIV